jgi:pimeloyl-ACP methyl ester carboxylesterase
MQPSHQRRAARLALLTMMGLAACSGGRAAGPDNRSVRPLSTLPLGEQTPRLLAAWRRTGAEWADWVDPSAKQVRFLAVPAKAGETVRLEIIDWGGRGPTVLLLAGLGESGHIYNDLAPRLTDRFRVIALTRRGHGASARADSSTCVLDTLGADIRAVMDSLQLQRASFVGHSIAGAEITRFAARWPERSEKLIYLDASHDFAGIDSVLAANPAWPPRFSPPSGTATDTLNAARDRFKHYRFGYWSDALESGVLRTPDPDEACMNALLHDATVHPKEYHAVRAPALAFTPRYTMQNWFFYLDPVADSVKWKAAEQWLANIVQPWLEAGHARFRREMPTSRTIEFEGDHHFFNSQPEWTLGEIRKFLLSS